MDEHYARVREWSPERIASHLKAYRKVNQLSQEQLAAKLGIGRASLARWEGGVVRISNIMLRYLVEEKVV